jgi:hypothetical protein
MGNPDNPCIHYAATYSTFPEYWFTSDTSGTITGNHTITYSTFDQLVDAANLGDTGSRLKCSVTSSRPMNPDWCAVRIELAVSDEDAAKELFNELRVHTAVALGNASLNPGFSWSAATELATALKKVADSEGF